ncbi:hypothetical protein HF086_011600 [Spodoptera exigua]|uniref:Uncharacterized protein n=1 Tax=Spodoptera exigua TaxID=7107 RepID=A0A922SE55_SPOEX|nr:hypothetical protein HF086_011600 [Spodoptera exigua]
MMRFFTQIHPKIPPRGSNLGHPECLSVVKGNLVSYNVPKRDFADDKDIPQRDQGREEKQAIQMPGFVHPEPISDEGLLTQKVRKQIEEYKKKKDKPTLRPEGRE